MKCPHCRNRLVQKSMDGMVRIRTQILVFDAQGAASVVCKSCRAEVPIDVTLGTELRKSVTALALVVSRKAVDTQ